MGLTTWVLGRVKQPLAQGFRLGKLLFGLWHTGPRPLRLAEKVAVFAAGQKHPQLALQYYVLRIVLGLVLTKQDAHKALVLLPSRTGSDADEPGYTQMQMEEGVRAAQNTASSRTQAALAFAAVISSRRAADSYLARRYGVEGGRFDAESCLVDYYSSSQTYRFQQLCKDGADKQRLQDEALRIWQDIRTRTRNDAVDLFLL